MPDPPPPRPNAETGHDTDRGAPPGVPRWVKVSGIIVAILVLALVAVMLIGGDHGPSRHATGDQPTELKAPGDEPPGGHDSYDWGHG